MVKKRSVVIVLALTLLLVLLMAGTASAHWAKATAPDVTAFAVTAVYDTSDSLYHWTVTFTWSRHAGLPTYWDVWKYDPADNAGAGQWNIDSRDPTVTRKEANKGTWTWTFKTDMGPEVWPSWRLEMGNLTGTDSVTVSAT